MKRMVVLAVGAFALVFGAQVGNVSAAEKASNLRGYEIAKEKDTPAFFRLDVSQKQHERSFKQQPPMVPHRANYEVNLKKNECLDCHDKATYKKEEAPLAGKSHYTDLASGKEQDKIIMNRWFCSQCHAPMTDATPLVENVFQGAK